MASPALREALEGVTEIDTSEDAACELPGSRDSVATAVWLELLVLVAVTMTVCGPVIESGALYIPSAPIFPTAGFKVHVTADVTAPLAIALRGSVFWACKTAKVGIIDSTVKTGVLGISDSIAFAVWLGSSRLRAVSVTV